MTTTVETVAEVTAERDQLRVRLQMVTDLAGECPDKAFGELIRTAATFGLRFDRVEAQLAAAAQSLDDRYPSPEGARAKARAMERLLISRCPGVHAPVAHRDGSVWCLACRRTPDGVKVVRRVAVR